MTRYDPAIIQGFAETLYRRASALIVLYSLAGLVVGGVAGVLVAKAYEAGAYSERNAMIVGFMVAVLGVCIGFGVGSARAFALKLQAQTALCQVMIEDNTRAIRAQTSGQLAAAPPPR